MKHHKRLRDGRWIAPGMHCTCPDGYGIVVSWVRDEIHVQTDVNDRGCFWAAHNVELAPPMTVQPRGEL